MQALIESLRSAPGVVGGLVCTPEGRVVAHAFPPTFDEASLQEAASVLADGCVGLDAVTGSLGLVDLRYAQARLVARPIAHGLLLLVCDKTVNLQLLLISIAATSRKIEKLLAEVKQEQPPDPGPEAGVERPQGGRKAKGKKSWWPSV